MPQRRESQPGAETPQQHAARIGKSLTNRFCVVPADRAAVDAPTLLISGTLRRQMDHQATFAGPSPSPPRHRGRAARRSAHGASRLQAQRDGTEQETAEERLPRRGDRRGRGAVTKRLSPTFRPSALMEMVRGDTGADVDRQIESLQRVGMLKLEQR